MILNKQFMESGFEMFPRRTGDYRVWTESTGHFLISSTGELTEDRVEQERVKFAVKQVKANEWEKEYKDKLKTIEPSSIWCGADYHIGHCGILLHHPDRMEAMGVGRDYEIEKLNIQTSEENKKIVSEYWQKILKVHDEWIIDIWNTTINKKDVVYLVGDIIWSGNQIAEKILHKLYGKKHLIVGNHDKNLRKLTNMFVSVEDLKTVRFKRDVFPFIEEFEFITMFCHYPMVSWDGKSLRGTPAINIHGHCHNNITPFNNRSTDLRLDVGFDADFNYHSFAKLEDVYCWYKKKRILIDDIIENR
jgi:calcineurin-like phosphoesterase family protein